MPSGSAPDSVNSSVWQMPVALISTSTSPALRAVEVDLHDLQRLSGCDGHCGARFHIGMFLLIFRARVSDFHGDQPDRGLLIRHAPAKPVAMCRPCASTSCWRSAHLGYGRHPHARIDQRHPRHRAPDLAPALDGRRSRTLALLTVGWALRDSDGRDMAAGDRDRVRAFSGFRDRALFLDFTFSTLAMATSFRRLDGGCSRRSRRQRLPADRLVDGLPDRRRHSHRAVPRRRAFRASANGCC